MHHEIKCRSCRYICQLSRSRRKALPFARSRFVLLWSAHAANSAGSPLRFKHASKSSKVDSEDATMTALASTQLLHASLSSRIAIWASRKSIESFMWSRQRFPCPFRPSSPFPPSAPRTHCSLLIALCSLLSSAPQGLRAFALKGPVSPYGLHGAHLKTCQPENL